MDRRSEAKTQPTEPGVWRRSAATGKVWAEGSYLCQGKMPLSVRQRYESMQAQQPEKMQALMENFDRAQSHPDEADLKKFAQTAAQWIGKGEHAPERA